MLPEMSEVDVVRHFTRLSTYNYAVDFGLYPLGSCTMKYNPKINEEVARLEGFARLHPLQPESTVQGALELMDTLQEALCAISGMDACTLQPSAGAQGEFTGVQLIRAYLETRGDARKVILIPDSAHGTNPASAALRGLRRGGGQERARRLRGRGGAQGAHGAGRGGHHAHRAQHPGHLREEHRRDLPASCTPTAPRSTWTAPTSTPSWASPGPATGAPTSCTSTSTRPSPRPTAAAARAPAPWSARRTWSRSCPGPSS